MEVEEGGEDNCGETGRVCLPLVGHAAEEGERELVGQAQVLQDLPSGSAW